MAIYIHITFENLAANKKQTNKDGMLKFVAKV
jgi:hypothetical protein